MADPVPSRSGCDHVWGDPALFADAFAFTISEVWAPSDIVQQCLACGEVRQAVATEPCRADARTAAGSSQPAAVLNVIDMADFVRRRDAQTLAYFCAVQEAARKLRVTVAPDIREDSVVDCLKVDASALDPDGLGIVEWYLWPSDTDPAMWHHPQSHVDQSFALSDVLLGIASVYVNTDEVTPGA